MKIIETKTEKRIQEVVTVTKTTSAVVILDEAFTNASQGIQVLYALVHYSSSEYF